MKVNVQVQKLSTPFFFSWGLLWSIVMYDRKKEKNLEKKDGIFGMCQK